MGQRDKIEQHQSPCHRCHIYDCSTVVREEMITIDDRGDDGFCSRLAPRGWTNLGSSRLVLICSNVSLASLLRNAANLIGWAGTSKSRMESIIRCSSSDDDNDGDNDEDAVTTQYSTASPLGRKQSRKTRCRPFLTTHPTCKFPSCAPTGTLLFLFLSSLQGKQRSIPQSCSALQLSLRY